MRCWKKRFIKKFTLFLILLNLTIFRIDLAHAEIYSIHIASYKTLRQAKIDVNRLHLQGYSASVREAHVPGSGKWYRVYAGQYANRQKALIAATEMKRAEKIDKFFIHTLPETKSVPKANKVQFIKTKKPKSPSSPVVVAGNKMTNNDPSKSDVKAAAGLNVTSPQKIKQKTISKKEEFRSARSNKQNTAQEKKEAFKALIMGNQKLMPEPPLLAHAGKSAEEVFKEPGEKDIFEPASDSPIYNKALAELKEKKYSQALVTFKEFISRKDTQKEWGQRALRHMADCHYWLGKAGSKENLLIAAEFYKNTLENFPDPRRENALTYYRLAKTYEHLKYYPESIRQYQNLIAKYPDAPYVPEAYFKIGEIYYTDGKYNEAAEALIRYQMKYRGRANTKRSFYLIAHSFYKAKQSTNAEVWFRDSWKQWPDLSDMPKDLLLDVGLHKMSLRRFDEAVRIFSFYVNLYPDDEKSKEVLKLLASAFRQSGQPSPALAVYNRIIDKYPGTKEAKESMLAMADLGVENPGLKIFRFLNHTHFYRNPMDTYDTLILQNVTGDIAEDAMLQKAAALVKKGEGRRAADVYLDFLRLYPQSKRMTDASRGLKTASAALIEEYYAKNDYLAVAYVYFKSYGAVAIQADEYPQVKKIALSLKELALLDDYLIILQRYLKIAGNEAVINIVSLDIAEGLIMQKKYDDAQNILNALAAKPSVRKSAMMIGVRKNMAEIAYRKQLYGQAVANYHAVVGAGQELSDPGRTYIHYARSLKEQKENEQALQNYLTAVKYLNEDKSERVNAGIAYKELGDLYLHKDNMANGLAMYGKAFDFSTDAELKLWSRFLMGKTYLKMNKEEQAQNTFAQIKTAAGAEGFWSKVVDFYAADVKWWDKYGNTVTK